MRSDATAAGAAIIITAAGSLNGKPRTSQSMFAT
jgi:hypothetical protein